MRKIPKDKVVSGRITPAEKMKMDKLGIKVPDAIQYTIKTYENPDAYKKNLLDQFEKDLLDKRLDIISLENQIEQLKRELGYIQYTNDNGFQVELTPDIIRISDAWVEWFKKASKINNKSIEETLKAPNVHMKLAKDSAYLNMEFDELYNIVVEKVKQS